MATRPGTPEVGALFAQRYRVEKILGKGGMGVVVAVCDQTTNEPLAIKLLAPPADEDGPDSTENEREAAARLVREARAVMRIVSKHVVRVRDVASSSELGPFIVMERLEGRDLADLSPMGSKMPVSQAADVAIQVCEALSQAHEAGIVHRDIKPSNLFVTRDGDEEIVKVLDFGISKVTTREDWERTAATLTTPDAVLGSPQFVSPEQLRDPRSVDGRTDLWALGVVLYRLLTGRYPFSGRTIGELFFAILEAAPTPLADHGCDAPDAMQAIVSRCLTRDLDARYATAAELAHDLAPLASPRWSNFAVLIEARRPRLARSNAPASSVRPPPSIRPPRRGTPRTFVLLALVALGLGTGALVVMLQRRAAPAAGAAMESAPPASSVSFSSSAAAMATEAKSAAGAEPASTASITVVLVADAPIEKVRAPGVRRVALEDGRATVTLAPFEGTIDVEAELAGGLMARGHVSTEGPRDVRLTTTPRSALPLRPATTAGTSASASPSTMPSASARSDLHANPYGGQRPP